MPHYVAPTASQSPVVSSTTRRLLATAGPRFEPVLATIVAFQERLVLSESASPSLSVSRLIIRSETHRQKPTPIVVVCLAQSGKATVHIVPFFGLLSLSFPLSLILPLSLYPFVL